MCVSVDCGEASIAGSFLHILGWPKGAILKGKQQAPGLGDITRGVRAAYVYVDFIQPTNAGSFQVQLLKKIPVGSHRPGDIIEWHARTPVETHHLNTQTISRSESPSKTSITRCWTSTVSTLASLSQSNTDHDETHSVHATNLSRQPCCYGKASPTGRNTPRGLLRDRPSRQSTSRYKIGRCSAPEGDRKGCPPYG